jgi:alpha-L-rhamnosidase
MKMKKSLWLLIIFTITSIPGNAIINPPKNLKVNYNVNPLGMDDSKPGFSWEVGDLNRKAIQSAYQIIVSSSRENLEQGIGDEWDSKKVPSNQTIQVIYQGKPLQSGTRYYWAVRTWDANGTGSGFSNPAWFETGLLDKNDWKGIWISDKRAVPEKEEDFYEKIPAPLFRKAFQQEKQVKKARLYISGLGYFEAYLNGEKIGNHRLDPGWTQYARTVYYTVHDVTNAINKGENVLGVQLGNGWYNPLPMRMFSKNLREVLTIGKPKVIAQLKLEYQDGTSELIKTDLSWKTHEGPIVRNNIYLGEWYDANMEQEGWTLPGYNDKHWEKVEKAEAPAGQLTWQFIPPIRKTKTFFPVKINQPEEGVHVVDMGQNFAGVIQFKVNAPKGTEIKFRYAEMVLDDGNIDIRSSAAAQIKYGQGGPGAPEVAWQEDRYICKGEGTEIFEPKFTFHGFRYVEITGLPSPPSLNDIVGIKLRSDVQENGSFTCSNELFNRIQEITRASMSTNIFSVQSDCPAREKYGYGGDIVAVSEAYIYNFDMANFYTKTARDFARDAWPSGAMTECAPNIGVNAGGVTKESGPVGWTLAHPFILDKLYRYYGNLEMVKEQYQPLKNLVDFYHENVPGHIITKGIGDHKCVDQRPTPVTSTAFYYHHVKILADMAGKLGKEKDAVFYGNLSEEIKKAFIEKFVDKETGEVYSHNQSSQSFALYYDLLPGNLKDKAMDVLEEEILIKHLGHLATGIFSTKYMLDYLHGQNRNDLAYLMINQKDYPGYGYMIKNDATTLWENWSIVPHHSQNHPMFGSVSEWFFKAMAGIGQTENSVAFSEIIIKPAILDGLNWARGNYHSMRGNIAVEWWKSGNDILVDVEIPANTTAEVYLPKYSHRGIPEIYEGNTLLYSKTKPVTEEIKLLKETNKHYIYSIGSGKYNFKVKY